ncbi:MAG: SMC family ATPase [Bacillota bacterium]
MVLTHLRMRNFKRFREAEVGLTLGLTGVIGRNGSGKSSIFEAIIFALYGRVGFVKEYVRFQGANEREPVEIELSFEVKGRPYRVVREFRGKALAARATLYGPDGSPLASGQTEVTGAVVGLTGLDEQAFCRTVFSGQKELTALSESSGNERKEMVRKMIGLERVDAVYQMVSDDRLALRREADGMEKVLLQPAEVEELTSRLDHLGRSLQAVDSALGQAQDCLRQAAERHATARYGLKVEQERQRRYEEIGREMVREEERGIALAEAVRRLEGEIAQLLAEGQRLVQLEPDEGRYQELTSLRRELDEEEKRHQRRLGLQEQLAKAWENAAHWQGVIDRAETELAPYAQLDQIIEAARVTRDGLAAEEQLGTAELERAQRAIGAIQGNIADRRRKIEAVRQLGPDGPCPICTRPLREQYNEVITALLQEIAQLEERKLAALQETVAGLTSRRQVLQTERARAESELAELGRAEERRQNLRREAADARQHLAEEREQITRKTEELAALGEERYDPTALERVREELGAIEPLHAEYQRLLARADRLPGLEQERLATIQRRRECAETLSRLQESQREVGFSDELLARARAAEERALAAKEEAQQRLGQLESQRVGLVTEASGLEHRLAEDSRKRAILDQKRAELRDLEKLAEVLKSFRTAVLEKVRPDISAEATNLFNQITRGRYAGIRVTEEFEFEILDQGQYYPIRRFSGGEIDLANLCLRIAIGKVVARLSGAGLVGFLGFDEIFGSQDEERRREIMDALHRISEEFRQVFIITHIDEVKEDFPNVLQVYREAGSSRLVWR